MSGLFRIDESGQVFIARRKNTLTIANLSLLAQLSPEKNKTSKISFSMNTLSQKLVLKELLCALALKRTKTSRDEFCFSAISSIFKKKRAMHKHCDRWKKRKSFFMNQ